MNKESIFIISLGILVFLVASLASMNAVVEITGGAPLESNTFTTAAVAPTPPVASDDAYSTAEDIMLEVDAQSGILVNDIDEGGDYLYVQSNTEPSHGTLHLNSDGSFTYLPNPDWFGTDSFEYEVYDGDLADIGTVTITVTPVNDPAVAVDDHVVTDEDTPVIIDYIANDYDPDGEPFQLVEYYFDEAEIHGVLEWEMFEVAPGVQRMAFRYTPDPDWYGSTSTLVYYVADRSGIYSSPAMVYITVNPVSDEAETSVTYTGDLTGTYSDPIVLEALLVDKDTQSPLEARTINFEFGDMTYSAITDAYGMAFVRVILENPAGTYLLSVSFDGSDEYLPSLDMVELTVLPEVAYVVYTGHTVISSHEGTMFLRATILDDEDGYWGDMTRINITFTIYGADSLELIEVLGPYSLQMTDIEGVGIVTLELPNLPPNVYLVVVSVDPSYNIYYEGFDSEEAFLVVVEPTGDHVTGAGWIWDSSDERAHFAFMAKYHRKGHLIGNLLYTFKDGDWHYLVMSRSIVGLAIEDDHAFFEGTAFIWRFNTQDRTLEYLGHEFLFRIDVWDGKRDDVFQIVIYDKNGLIFHEAGEDSLGEVQRGNIKIHSQRKWTFCHCHNKIKKSHNRYGRR